MRYRLARVPPAMVGPDAMGAIIAAAPQWWVESEEARELLQAECKAKGLIPPGGGNLRFR